MRWSHAQLIEAHHLVRVEHRSNSEAARILSDRWGVPISKRQAAHAVEQLEKSGERWTEGQLAEMWRLFRVEGKTFSQAADALNALWNRTDITRNVVAGAVNRYELRAGLKAKRPEERSGRAFAPIPNTYKASNGVTLASSAGAF